MVQVINGEIKQYSLSKTGTLKDGRTVSGYHLLDEEILLDEGWLPLEDNPPGYDVETQYLVQDGYEILEDKVIKKYIKIESVTINGLNLIRTFSDTDYKIHKVGTNEIYDEAVDVIGHPYIYEETTEKREPQPTTEPEMREALTILGVDVS